MHTLTPGMLFRDGRPWVLHGSMGGEIQPQVFAQFVSALVDGRMPIADAVAAPRWAAAVGEHDEQGPSVHLEGGMDPGVAVSLEARGHVVTWRPRFDAEFGHEHAIAFLGDAADAAGSRDQAPATPRSWATCEATADPRSEGLPAAF